MGHFIFFGFERVNCQAGQEGTQCQLDRRLSQRPAGNSPNPLHHWQEDLEDLEEEWYFLVR